MIFENSTMAMVSEQNTRSPHCFNGQLYGRFLVSTALILKQMTALSNPCSFECFATILIFFFVSFYSLNSRSHSIASFLPARNALLCVQCVVTTTYLRFDSRFGKRPLKWQRKWYWACLKKRPYMTAVCLLFNLFGIL